MKRLLILLCLLAAAGLRAESALDAPEHLSGSAALARPSSDPLGLDHYGQLLVLDMGSPEAARAVSVTVAPLYRDAKWAVTQRWDDNLVDSLRVRDLLNRNYMHGTFYMNASDAWYSNESRYPFSGDLRQDLGRALLKGGHSVGGHSLTHNFVPDLNRQEIFWELMGIRIDREVNTQSPVDSFVFPFTTFQNAFEPQAVHADIASSLRRSGYLHVGNQYFNFLSKQPTGLLTSWLLPCDGQAPIDPAIRKLLGEEKQRDKEPDFCFCMHAWPANWGGQAFPKLAQEFRHWRGRSIWWYAQANELASYRYQAMHGDLQVRVEGSKVYVAVDRFEPWDLGDAIPLTLKLADAADLTVTATLDAAQAKLSLDRDKHSLLVELPHSPGHGLPDVYDWHRNHANKPAGLDEKGRGFIQGLASRLWLADGRLHLRLANQGPSLDQLRLAWRLPVGWAPAPKLHRSHLAAGQHWDIDLDLVPEGTLLQHAGRFYAAVQLDALRGTQRLRLYSDVRAENPPRDPSYPKGGFAVLGPLPASRNDYTESAFSRRTLTRKVPRPSETPFDGETDAWQACPDALQEPLHPEIIPAGALMAPRTFYTWDSSVFYDKGHRLHYLLMTDLFSPVSRTAHVMMPPLTVRRLYLNRRRVRGLRLALKAGRNRLAMDYAAGTADSEGMANFNERNYGPYFRLTDAAGRRFTDIRYEIPAGLTDSAQPTDTHERP